MQIFGLMVVRNEADIIRVNVLHHLSQGIDQFLIVDNGSSDGTDQVLNELSQDPRVRWTRHVGEFCQGELTTQLAREAYLRGADWVVPIDADEFWYAPAGNFRSVLEQSTAGALRVEIVNYVQRRDQLEATPDALLHMNRRPPMPIGPVDRIIELVETRQIGFVEILYPSKYISRASFVLEIDQGNHWSDRLDGPRQDTREIICLHAPLRARSVLESKVDRDRPPGDLDTYLRRAWHVQRWRRLASAGPLDQEWAANSYLDDHLDVYGVPHRLVVDMTLCAVVAPWINKHLPEPTQDTEAIYSPPFDLKPCFPDTRDESLAAIVARMQDIEGWLSEPEARLLATVAATALLENDPQAVVEIGSYCGKSTIVLGSVVKVVSPESRVYAIDPHEGEVTLQGGKIDTHPPTLQKFTRNIAEAGLTEIVETIQKRSYEVMWNKPISLLFIDGLHDYANTTRDFQHFEAWVVPGGYVIFDDYDAVNYPGVVTCVNEILGSGRFREVQRVGKVIATQKIAHSITLNGSHSKESGT